MFLVFCWWGENGLISQLLLFLFLFFLDAVCLYDLPSSDRRVLEATKLANKTSFATADNNHIEYFYHLYPRSESWDKVQYLSHIFAKTITKDVAGVWDSAIDKVVLKALYRFVKKIDEIKRNIIN